MMTKCARAGRREAAPGSRWRAVASAALLILFLACVIYICTHIDNETLARIFNAGM
jgi:succinate dehydrogenase hydrophobic anchor subunit